MLIFLVALLLGAALFTDGSYRPFVKLTPQDISSVTIQLASGEAHRFQDTASIHAAVLVLQQINILFSADPQGDALATVEVEFTTGQAARLILYAHCLSIDDKSYSLSASASEALLSGLKAIR